MKLSSRKVWIKELDLIEVTDENRALFRVVCGKGTYVRSLARDLGEKLGTKAHVTKLRRTRVGKFSLEGSISLDQIQEIGHKVHTKGYIHSIAEVLDDIPALCLTTDQYNKMIKGQAVDITDEQTQGLKDQVLCLHPQGQATAIAAFEDGRIKPRRVFNIETI